MRIRDYPTLKFLTLGGALLLLLGGCAVMWNTTPGPHKIARLGLSADLPAGWARFAPDRDIVMTRDGFMLQTIFVTRAQYGSELAYTERTFSKGIEPQDAAQILIDSLAADQSRHQFAVVDNRPDTVLGQPGCRIEITYRTPERLTMREAYCVALAEDSYVIARYSAPDRHYFDHTRGEFDVVIASLRFVGPPPPLQKKRR